MYGAHDAQERKHSKIHPLVLVDDGVMEEIFSLYYRCDV